MKVKELIEKISKYNPEADFNIIVDSMPTEFEICFGRSEGCTMKDCESVDLFVDARPEVAL